MTIADPDDLIEFPCDYLFKAFCAKDAVASFRGSIKEAINRVVLCSNDAIKERKSSQGNYACITALVRLESRVQLEAINNEIRKIDDLMFMI